MYVDTLHNNSHILNYSIQVTATICFMAPVTNLWYSLESQVTTIMLLNICFSPASTCNLPANDVVYEALLINSMEKVKLPRALSIKSGVVWKAQSL